MSGNSRSGRRIALGLLVVSIVAICSLTLLPVHERQTNPPQHFCFVCGEYGMLDVILNVLLFVPLGISLALLRVRALAAFAFCLGLTLAIELLQLSVITGRDASISDICTNTAGGMLGFWCGGHWRLLWAPSPTVARTLAAISAVVFIGAQALGGLFMKASPSGEDYFGQTSESLEEEPRLPAIVNGAWVADVPIPPTLLDTAVSRSIERGVAQVDGVPIHARLTLNGTSVDDFTTIVSVTDRGQRAIIGLSMKGHDLVFAVGGWAKRMRVRPILFRLRGAFAVEDSRAAVPVEVGGRMSGSRVQMWRIAGADTATMSTPVRTIAGWRVLAPAAVFVDDDWAGRLADAVWVALLVVPLGFASTIGATSSRQRNVAALFIAAVVTAGFVIGPAFFRLAGPGASGILGVAVGVVGGVMIGRLAMRNRSDRTI